WGDRMWMCRFDGWEKPSVVQKDSATLIVDFDELKRARVEADERISNWAARVNKDWLAEEQAWFSQSVNKELRQPRSMLVAHFFNPKPPRGGRPRAMIPACGEKTGDTDLFLVV